jgi:hypothetical protein
MLPRSYGVPKVRPESRNLKLSSPWKKKIYYQFEIISKQDKKRKFRAQVRTHLYLQVGS